MGALSAAAEAAEPSGGAIGGGELVLLLVLAALFPALRWLLHTAFFEPVSRRLLQQALLSPDGKPAPERPAAKQQVKVEKLCESLWKFLVYTVFMFMGVAALWRQPWLQDTRELWNGWPNHEFSTPMRVLYYSELSFYFSSIFTLLFWEVRRNDFAVMFTHHITTVALLGASLHLRFWRVGCLVMALHDACDVLMEAAKAFNYTRRDSAATAAFAAFLVTWAALRLTVFPLMAVRSALVELPVVLGGRPPMWWGFCGGLLLLQALHVYWFTLIMRVAVMRVATGGGRDLREEEEEDEM